MKIKGVIGNNGEAEETIESSMRSSIGKNRNLQSWRTPLPLLFKIRHEALTHKHVKNEDSSGDVYEKTGKATKCTPINPAFCTKMYQSLDNQTEIGRLFGQECANYWLSWGERSSQAISPWVEGGDFDSYLPVSTPTCAGGSIFL